MLCPKVNLTYSVCRHEADTRVEKWSSILESLFDGDFEDEEFPSINDLMFQASGKADSNSGSRSLRLAVNWLSGGQVNDRQ